MIDFIRRWFGDKVTDQVGPPEGKTGNEWTEDDYADSTSELALKGGPEFVEFCINAGTCELDGAVMEKFREILQKYPASDEEEYDHLGVLVRQRLVAAKLLPKDDPERYQYKVAQWGSTFAQHDRKNTT